MNESKNYQATKEHANTLHFYITFCIVLRLLNCIFICIYLVSDGHYFPVTEYTCQNQDVTKINSNMTV